MKRRVLLLTILMFVLPVGACHLIDRAEPPAVPLGESISLAIPLGLPAAPSAFEANGNRLTASGVALGRRLFFERELSSDRTISCASCHQPVRLFTDGLPAARGVGGQTGKRNTPGVVNAVYWSRQFWDGRAADLEEQAGGPIANPIEMNLPHEVAIGRLAADPGYRRQFETVFGPGPITMARVVRAIAAYESTLLSGNSPFDRYYYAGEKGAMSAAAIRGLEVFRNPAKGNCAQCHTIGERASLLTDGLFHNLGTGMDSNGELTDPGRYAVTKLEADRGAFRTPSLRNVARTAPYMHDGRLKSLREVIDFYIGGGSSNPQLDPMIRPLILSAGEREDLEVFLEALTGEAPNDPKELKESQKESQKEDQG